MRFLILSLIDYHVIMKGDGYWKLVMIVDSVVKGAQKTEEGRNYVVCCYHVGRGVLEKQWHFFESPVSQNASVLKWGGTVIMGLTLQGKHDTSMKFINVENGETLKVLKFGKTTVFRNVFDIVSADKGSSIRK